LSFKLDFRPSVRVTRDSQLKTKTSKLPFVLINMAITADGKIATANRAISSFGSAFDHKNLLQLRATADAVMAGARTVDLNPINMGPGSAAFRRERLKRGLSEYNLRVIVSGSGTVDPKSEVFKRRFSPIIVLTTGRASDRKLAILRTLADEVKVLGKDEINFREALLWLRSRWKIKRLLCEGGGELNSALFEAGLINEVHLTLCPKIFGGRTAPTIADGVGFSRLADANQLTLKSLRRIGDELFLVYSRR
jgi:riboflavin-specific deaminase-like protein